MKPDTFARHIARRTLQTLSTRHYYRFTDSIIADVVKVVTAPKALNAILKEESDDAVPNEAFAKGGQAPSNGKTA